MINLAARNPWDLSQTWEDLKKSNSDVPQEVKEQLCIHGRHKAGSWLEEGNNILMLTKQESRFLRRRGARTKNEEEKKGRQRSSAKWSKQKAQESIPFMNRVKPSPISSTRMTDA